MARALTEPLARARPHVERQGDGVVDHHLRRQVALALARLAGFCQNLAHPFGRYGPGDYPKADMIAQTDAGWKAGSNTGHRCRSRITRPAVYDPNQTK